MPIKVSKGRDRGKLDRVEKNYSHKCQHELKILSKVPRILGDLLIKCLRTLIETDTITIKSLTTQLKFCSVKCLQTCILGQFRSSQ